MIKQKEELTDYEKELFSWYIKDWGKRYNGFEEVEIVDYIIENNSLCVNFYSKFFDQVVQSDNISISKYKEKTRNYRLNKLLN